MEKEFNEFNKINISQFKIKIKLEEGPFWAIYKVENINNANEIYAAKIIIKEYEIDDHNISKYISYVKQELNSMTKSSLLEFKGLSLTDFNGNNNITIFLNFKKYYNFFKLRESFSNYSKIDINQYKIKTTMKKTDFVAVYQVFNKNKSNEVFAAKNYKNNNNENEKEMDQYIFNIKQIIDMMINCKNPTLLEFKGLSLTDFSGSNNITIFTNFVSKGLLSKICFKTSNPPQNYDNTAIQIILVGISYAMMVLHKNKMIHNSIEPENVLLDKNLHPVINISKMFNSKSSSKDISGSIYYLAPEILTALHKNDSPKFNQTVDIYAFGILMYEIITKNRAFDANISLCDLYNRVVVEKERPQFNGQVKGSIQKLINKCWSPEIDNRISFEQIFDILSFNIEDKKSQNSYNKYYLDGVDVDKLFDYISSIIDNNIDLDVLLEKIKENIKDNKNVLENNKCLSKKVVNIINDVIRNKEKLIIKIEKIMSQPISECHVEDKPSSNSSFESSNNQQNSNTEKPEIENSQNSTTSCQLNQDEIKHEQQIANKKITRQYSYNINEPNTKYSRTKISLNQKNKTTQIKPKKASSNNLYQKQKQDQLLVKQHRDLVQKQNEDNKNKMRTIQQKINSLNNGQQQQKTNQKKHRARTPTFLMHKLNQQLRTPLNSSIQTMNQKQSIKIRSQDSKSTIENSHKNNHQTQSSSNKASSVNSKQSKRSITPDNLTYMLKKKREMQLNNLIEQQKNKNSKQKLEPNQNDHHKEQLYTKQTNNTQQQNKECLNNVQQNKEPKKQNVLNTNQIAKTKRSKTPDYLIQKSNNQRRNLLYNEEQKPKLPRSSRTKSGENSAIDNVSYDVDHQNLMNRNLKREELEFWLNKRRQSPVAENITQQNRQSKKQSHRTKQTKKSKFKI